MMSFAPGPGLAITRERAICMPARKLWLNATVDVSRSQSKFCADENLKVGQPYGFEQVYEVPQRYANEIYGVVLVNNSNAQPNQVLSPPG